MNIRGFIKRNPSLVWYTENYDSLSEAAIVEAVLNYGDWGDVQKLIKILGVKKVAGIFREQTGKGRSNYREKVKNFFSLYFRSRVHA